jgi:hypothetical protein
VSREHHIWCNHWHQPIEECKSCKRLFALYPEKEDDPLGIALMKEHFPDNMIINPPPVKP